MPERGAILATVLAVSLAGCASLQVERSGLVLEHGKFAEANLRLDAGDVVSWTWSSSQQLRFNVHTHDGSDVSELVKRQGTQDAGSFTAAKAGGYSLLWVNDSAEAVTLDYRVSGDGALDSALP